MAKSSMRRARQFKSPDRVVIKFLQNSRDLKTGKYRKLKKDFVRLRDELARTLKKYEELEVRHGELNARYRNLEFNQFRREQNTIVRLPNDPSIGQHGFGPRMVVLGIALAKAVGFRAAARVMLIVFKWLGVQQKVPHFTTIRGWMQRQGVAVMHEPVEKADDWVWMADHSNQIGQDKILVVLGIRASQMPPPEIAITRSDMTVFAVRPGQSWKREDVATVYADLEQKYGTPRAILCDGAVELRESVSGLKRLRTDLITLQDFKHKAANFLEALVGKSEKFQEFLGHIGTTRCGIQQTEMAHLTPPVLRNKARFMNLGPLVEWSTVILWLLKNPQAAANQWMTSVRLESKLGWVKSFELEIATWDECQQVIDHGLTFINTQGLFVGAADQLHQAIGADLKHPLSQQLANRLVEFVKAAENQLKVGERLPLSTEILESSFGLYKQLEGQHSKGGFTSLIVTFAALLTEPTVATIEQNFTTTSTKDVKAWLKKHLDTTVASKRRSTYQEMKQATGRCRTRSAKKTTLIT